MFVFSTQHWLNYVVCSRDLQIKKKRHIKEIWSFLAFILYKMGKNPKAVKTQPPLAWKKETKRLQLKFSRIYKDSFLTFISLVQEIQGDLEVPGKLKTFRNNCLQWKLYFSHYFFFLQKHLEAYVEMSCNVFVAIQVYRNLNKKQKYKCKYRRV